MPSYAAAGAGRRTAGRSPPTSAPSSTARTPAWPTCRPSSGGRDRRPRLAADAATARARPNEVTDREQSRALPPGRSPLRPRSTGSSASASSWARWAPSSARSASSCRADYFFRAWLVGWVYWIGVALGCLALFMLHHLTRRRLGAGDPARPGGGRAHPALARLLALPILAGLFGTKTLYVWARPEVVAARRAAPGQGAVPQRAFPDPARSSTS